MALDALGAGIEIFSSPSVAYTKMFLEGELHQCQTNFINLLLIRRRMLDLTQTQALERYFRKYAGNNARVQASPGWRSHAFKEFLLRADNRLYPVHIMPPPLTDLHTLRAIGVSVDGNFAQESLWNQRGGCAQ